MDKKNTLLLTVIAIATLLVAVVGATFAYFTAQNGNTVTANMQVTTATTNTATISEFNKIAINANQFNFANLEGEGVNTAVVGSQMGETKGSIGFTASSAATLTEKYCYTVDLKVNVNTFQYTLGNKAGDKPELIFSISKAPKQSQAPGDTGEEYQEITEGITALTYNGSVLTTTVCQNDASNVQYNNTYHVVPESCKTEQLIKGWDVTTKTSTYSIPRLSSGDTENKNANVHEIDAASSATVTDYWKASVTFVNYKDSDLGDAAANQNDNASKNFEADLVFTPVSCEDGTPLNAE